MVGVTAPDPAWAAAVTTHAYLLTHRHPPPMPGPIPTVPLDAGEHVVAVFDSRAGANMGFARWAGTTVIYSEPSSVVVGSPRFVAAYALGALAMRSHTRRRARREAVSRWWPTQLLSTVVAPNRLWGHLAEPHRQPRWISFTYAHVTQINLTGTVLVACFEAGEPLRLAGDWAPWCAAVMAHYRYGPMAGSAVPALHQAGCSTLENQQR